MPSLQKPIDSAFGAASTAGEIIEGIDLSGKIVNTAARSFLKVRAQRNPIVKISRTAR
jgi:hypothetical protein